MLHNTNCGTHLLLDGDLQFEIEKQINDLTILLITYQMDYEVIKNIISTY